MNANRARKMRRGGPSATLDGTPAALEQMREILRAEDPTTAPPGSFPAERATWDGVIQVSEQSHTEHETEEDYSEDVSVDGTSATGRGELIAGQAQLHRPCATCRAARVLCDRQHPCGRCMRLNLEATCQAPPTVKRGRPPKDVQQKRLELLAADLLSTGLPPSARVKPSTSAAPSTADSAACAKARVQPATSKPDAGSAPAPSYNNGVLISTGCQTAPPYPSSNTFIAAAFPAAPMTVYAPVNMVEAGPSPSCVAWQIGPTANPMADATGGTAGAVPKVADAAAPAAATRLSQSTFLDENEAMRRISALRQQLRDCGIEPCA